MKKILISFSILLASAVVLILEFTGVLVVFGLMNSPTPSQSTIQAWEKNYKQDITDQFKDFDGHWVSADIEAYIYSYFHTSNSIEEHHNKLIEALNNYNVLESEPDVLVLRKSVTYSHPNGFDEWRFVFDKDSNLVSVLFANLDSEMDQHSHLVDLVNQYHTKRGMSERGHR